MVSWTCQRVVLNWPMFRSRGVSRFRDATVRSRVPGDGNISPWCVPGRQSVASFALHASRKWPRAGKSPVRGKIRAPCIRNAPQTAVGGCTARISCQEGALFAARTPRIMHGARILPSPAPPNRSSSRNSAASEPPEATFGMHGAQNLPRIAARERTAAESCHGKAPGNASRENLVTVGRRGNAFRGHFAIGECPGTHQGTILPSPDARKHINEELA